MTRIIIVIVAAALAFVWAPTLINVMRAIIDDALDEWRALMRTMLGRGDE